jgi:hypothetical protein
MTNDEKTALEIIYSLPDILKKLESKIDVIDNNIKILNNKIKLIKPNTSEQKTATLPEKPQLLPRAEAPDKMPSQSPSRQEQPERLVIGNKKVFGFIKTTSMKPVPGAIVKIFDNQNSLVKNITADDSGYWECRLPKGNFNCEILVRGVKVINKEFFLGQDMKELEVK